VRLLLVRHGETAWNAQGRLQGNLDVPLSDAGRRQARALAATVAAQEPRNVVTSPLSRTRETARLLALEPGAWDPRWAEADLGEWAGKLVPEIDATQYADWRAGRREPPGGETLSDVRERVTAALRELPGENTVVVTHGGPIRAVLRHLLGITSEHLVPVAPASLTVVDLAGTPRLAAYNVVPVLEGRTVQETPD